MYRLYFYKFLAAMLLIAAGTALLNFIADPYGIWNTPLIRGVNMDKNTGFHDRIRQYAAWANWEKPPQTVLLGTSRTADGLRADHAVFGDATVYNMALSGQPIHETLVLFKHALKGGRLRQAVIGLDFFAFNTYWAADVIDEKRLTSGPHYDLLFSIDTLTDSLATIRQNLATVEIVNSAHAADSMSMQNALIAPANAPARSVFIGVEQIFVTYHRPAPYRLYSHANPRTGRNTLDDFRELLRLAHASNIDLRLFISPSHAWHWEGVANVGLWENWEQWKRALATINREEAEKSGSNPWPLWDFSGYSSITTEAVPPAGSRARMQWYSDSSHYNRRCGDLVLDRIFGEPTTMTSAHEDFGILIDNTNVDGHLSDIRRARKQYADSHVADIKLLKTLPEQAWGH